jgi:hypothetical protein
MTTAVPGFYRCSAKSTISLYAVYHRGSRLPWVLKRFGNYLTAGWQNAGHRYKVLLFNAGIAKRKLERAQLILMSADTFGEEYFFRD